MNLLDFLFGNFEEKNLDKEVVTYKKGDYTTTITSFFDADGSLVSVLSKTLLTKLMPTEEEEKLHKLTLELEEAKEKEDYIRCAEVKKEMESLKVKT